MCVGVRLFVYLCVSPSLMFHPFVCLCLLLFSFIRMFRSVCVCLFVCRFVCLRVWFGSRDVLPFCLFLCGCWMVCLVVTFCVCLFFVGLSGCTLVCLCVCFCLFVGRFVLFFVCVCVWVFVCLFICVFPVA